MNNSTKEVLVSAMQKHIDKEQAFNEKMRANHPKNIGWQGNPKDLHKIRVKKTDKSDKNSWEVKLYILGKSEIDVVHMPNSVYNLMNGLVGAGQATKLFTMAYDYHALDGKVPCILMQLI